MEFLLKVRQSAQTINVLGDSATTLLNGSVAKKHFIIWSYLALMPNLLMYMYSISMEGAIIPTSLQTAVSHVNGCRVTP